MEYPLLYNGRQNTVSIIELVSRLFHVDRDSSVFYSSVSQSDPVDKERASGPAGASGKGSTGGAGAEVLQVRPSA